MGLLDDIFDAVGELVDAVAGAVTGGPSTFGAAPAGLTASSSGGSGTFGAAKRVTVTVKPWQGRIVYDADQWNADARLLSYWKNGEVISGVDARKYRTGWNIVPHAGRKGRVKLISVVQWTFWAPLLSAGTRHFNDLPGAEYVTSRELDDGQGFEVSVPYNPGQVAVVKPRYPKVEKRKIEALTGFWRMTRKGPKELSTDDAVDQMTERPCRDSLTRVRLKVQSDVNSYGVVLGPSGATVQEIVRFSHTRKIYETKGSRAFYVWCKLYSGLKGKIPSFIINALEEAMKGVAKGFDKATA